MKRTIPAKTVEVCDICHREIVGEIASTCVVCGREHCYTCRGILCGCMVEAPVCHECSGREDVRQIVGRCADKIVPLVKKRNAVLRRLKAKPNAGQRTDGK